ncbi:nucleotidyl transferase AbiEii/AbiGii toxin family protein [Steroidobacter sp. S1-65]|uniref:Nucleotidyl transferase AbiEii/AbiGii toxin family protein n=1 Tax=Steroidobacter gossypii TaxID=2805490 RepID=A0ABS1WV69_9GAMM|nr:nucleotidyl transferase AbiEii/AbiGii toxin family protein [Steroidobacter gossypii]MBM0104865.1 nucleotidyl transferase AbiEii/AbiGii toxin family protein [Steroidobacter gossypii]
MTSARDGLARSLQVKLAQHAKRISADPNLVLTRYAVERYLYRLSRSAHSEKFVLKGALLMLAWMGDSFRATRDADMLGFGDVSPESLAGIFAEICTVPVEPDAMTYLADTMRLEPIRIDDDYGGHRVTLMARMGAARLRVQIDIGVGDAVVPAPQWIEYPSLLNLPKPRLKAYTPATVIAEKFHAITVLGMLNSRLKDYYDLWSLSQGCDARPTAIAKALEATFQQRNTVLPDSWPVGLTSKFADDAVKRRQWIAFLEKSRVSAPTLAESIDAIRHLLSEPLKLAQNSSLSS